MGDVNQESQEKPAAGDWLSFIDSRDVREHCRKIDWRPCPAVAAYLVWQCERCTVAERHHALQRIVECHAGSPVTLPWKRDRTTLGEFLKRYVAIEEDALARVRQEDPSAVWTVRFEQSRTAAVRLPEELRAYPSYAIAEAVMREEFESDEDLVAAVVSQQYFPFFAGTGTTAFGADKATVRLGRDLEPLRVLSVPVDDGLEVCWGASPEWDFFECNWFDVPTPFQPGDLLHYVLPPWCDDRVFVATERTEPDRSTPEGERLYELLCERGDLTDMSVNGCEVSKEDGYVEFHRHQPDPLHMERYHGELEGHQRKLEPIAQFVRGELGVRECAEQCALIDLDTEHERHAVAVKEQSASFRDWFGFDLYAEGFERLQRDGGRIVRRDMTWEELSQQQAQGGRKSNL